jgi:hypothetical protein
VHIAPSLIKLAAPAFHLWTSVVSTLEHLSVDQRSNIGLLVSIRDIDRFNTTQYTFLDRIQWLSCHFSMSTSALRLVCLQCRYKIGPHLGTILMLLAHMEPHYGNLRTLQGRDVCECRIGSLRETSGKVQLITACRGKLCRSTTR